ncbi:MAG: hypothetical protein EOM92_15885 [Gammaproteobacteria bacterium]|nr:hypothetical protein [Gammaproteobacteria bacterium]
MEVITPVTATLKSTASTPTYVTTATWTSGVTYAKNAVVRTTASDGTQHDYRAQYSHTASTANSPLAGYWYWTDLGPSAVSSTITYHTNVDLSLYGDWTTGVQVSANARVHDPVDRHDYEATVLISAANNTTRPSSAVLSTDPTVAARWVDLGVANAWAAIDESSNSYLYGVDGGALCSISQLHIEFSVTEAVDRLFVAGMRNIAGLRYEVFLNGSGSASDSGVIPHNRLYSPLLLTDTGYWTPGQTTVTASATPAPNGTTSEAAFDLKETAVTNSHYLDYVGRVECLPADEFRFSIVAKPIGTRHLDIRVHALDAAGAVIDSKYTHFVYNLTTGTIPSPGYSSDTNIVGADQLIENVTGGYYRCHAFGLAPAGAKQLVVRVAIANGTAPTLYPATQAATASYSGSTSSGLILSSPQLCAVYWAIPWYQTDATRRAPASYVFPLTTIPAGTACQINFFASGSSATEAIAIGVIGVGKGQPLGNTEWGVETSYLSFSRKERNDTYGTVSFLKRGSAKQVTATGFVDTDEISGDEIQQAVIARDATPCLWDFNNTGSDYDRLRVYGFVTNFSSIIQAVSWESVSLTIEGLAE